MKKFKVERKVMLVAEIDKNGFPIVSVYENVIKGFAVYNRLCKLCKNDTVCESVVAYMFVPKSTLSPYYNAVKEYILDEHKYTDLNPDYILSDIWAESPYKKHLTRQRRNMLHAFRLYFYRIKTVLSHKDLQF